MDDDDFGREDFESWVASCEPDFSPEEARFAAECLLAVPIPERDQKARELFLDHPETLTPLLGILREQWETAPASVRDDAEYVYGFLEKIEPRKKGKTRTGRLLFDEREYFLGEAALIAGTTCRDLSRRDEARRWFDRSERWFLLTANVVLDLSRLSYQRLALLIEERRFGEVLEALPQLIERFEQAEAPQDALKCRFLEGNILKESGQLRESCEVFREICRQARELKNERLLASACVDLVQLHAELNEPEQALTASREAIPLLRRLGNRIELAKVQWGIGMLYRRQANSAAAIEAFRSAQMEFEDIEMRADVAALHLIIADLLLDAGQDPQAKWEIQAALPVIDEFKLVPEGIAALSLLRQSLQNHRINRQALRDLHGYFPDRES